MVSAYNPWLVVLSVAVAVIAPYVAIDLASRMKASGGTRTAHYWLAGAAVSLGTGIWSMHYIGLLAVSLHSVWLALAIGAFTFLSLAATFIIALFDARLADRSARHAQGLSAMHASLDERRKVERMKTEFVATVSHELRTPLTSIRGSLGLMAAGAVGELSEPARNLVRIAYDNSERLVRLINDLLDIEKIESGKLRFDIQPHALRPLLEQALDASRACGEQFAVGFACRGEIPDVALLVDSDRFMQVMSNLLSNAARFSPAGGGVEVAAETAAGAVRICVTDHGPGIPEEFRSGIFGKFSQADSSDGRKKGGTGLGLSIVKAIVERHGGHIGFDSTIGAGTTFRVTFPHEPVETQPEKRILVCEDDAHAAQAITAMLEQAGFRTDTASDLAQARAMLNQHRYLAMTLDLLLPDGDGVDLIRELRADERARNLPVIVLSADAEEGRSRLNAEEHPSVRWLSKPTGYRTLLSILRNSVESASSSKPLVLHVEDDPDVRHVVSSIAAGIANFEFAANLRDAMARIKLQRYSLIILDLGLPDGSGWDLLPALKQLEPPPPVMLFSSEHVAPEQVKSVAASLTESHSTSAELLGVISQAAGKVDERPRL